MTLSKPVQTSWKLTPEMREMLGDHLCAQGRQYVVRKTLGAQAAARVVSQVEGEFLDAIWSAWAQGMPITAISKSSGVSRGTIYKLLEQAGERRRNGKG